MGDDDLWIFINGQLVIDMGGFNGPGLPQSYVLDVLAAESLGVSDRDLLEVKLFHAERMRTGSSFRLSFINMPDSQSYCVPN